MKSEKKRMSAAAAAGSVALAIILFFFVLVIVAASLSGGDSPSAESPAQAGESTAPSPSEQSDDEGQLLVEDAYVRITYTGSGTVAGVDGVAYLYFKIDNLSDQEITVVPMDSYLNDTAIQLLSGTMATVAPGKSYVYPIAASYSAIGIQSYEELTELETKFEVWDADSATIESVGPFTVTIMQEAE